MGTSLEIKTRLYRLVNDYSIDFRPFDTWSKVYSSFHFDVALAVRSTVECGMYSSLDTFFRGSVPMEFSALLSMYIGDVTTHINTNIVSSARRSLCGF